MRSRPALDFRRKHLDLAARLSGEPRQGGRPEQRPGSRRHELVCTIDGDSRLRSDSLKEIVERFLSDPPGTMAVAGAVLVRNSRAT